MINMFLYYISESHKQFKIFGFLFFFFEIRKYQNLTIQNEIKNNITTTSHKQQYIYIINKKHIDVANLNKILTINKIII